MRKSLFFIVLCLLFSLTCNLPSTIQRSAETPHSSGASPTISSVSLSEGPTNTDGAEVIYIPPTTFLMGAAAGDSQAEEDERPAHQVSLGGFYIYAREVTNRMYSECVRAGACFPVQMLPNGPTSHHNDPAYADYPVVGVDWNMAREYCRWAGGRLPTEAEWELAARGADGFQYPWGNEPAPACNLLNMFGCLLPPDTQGVGSYPDGVSPFGLFDMAGNVWEWVNDWYSADYYSASPASNPFGPSAPVNPDQPYKVVRGGSWNSYPENVRATARAFANLYLPYDDLGFRCVAQPGAWPQELTLPEPGHAIPEWSGPDMVGVHIGEEPNIWLILRSAFSTCPDAAGNVHVHIQFDPSEDFDANFRLTGSLYSTGADTFPCQYDPTQHLLSCAGPADRLETRQGFMGDTYYVLQACIMNHATNQVVDCAELNVLQETNCSGGQWMTGCETSCNQANSIDLVCKTNDPSLVQWVHDELGYILTDMGGGWVVGNQCTLLFEPSDAQPNEVALICPGSGRFSPNANGNLGFSLCTAQACPYYIELPYPAHCFPPEWQLRSYGCQNENIIFVRVNTGVPDLASVWNGYEVHDAQGNQFACTSVAPSDVYCYAPEPAAISPVTVCLTIAGSQSCQTFNLPNFLPCREQQEPQPEEPQPQPGDPCNQYKNPRTCKDHPQCEWDNTNNICRRR